MADLVITLNSFRLLIEYFSWSAANDACVP